MKACKELINFLENTKGITFDCVGGLGIDTSLGKEECMLTYGIWFKYCPFCGKEIISEYDNTKGCWKWFEKTN